MGLQVLMVTRSRDAAERARALRVVAGVVERVQVRLCQHILPHQHIIWLAQQTCLR